MILVMEVQSTWACRTTEQIISRVLVHPRMKRVSAPIELAAVAPLDRREEQLLVLPLDGNAVRVGNRNLKR